MFSKVALYYLFINMSLYCGNDWDNDWDNYAFLKIYLKV